MGDEELRRYRVEDVIFVGLENFKCDREQDGDNDIDKVSLRARNLNKKEM